MLQVLCHDLGGLLGQFPAEAVILQEDEHVEAEDGKLCRYGEERYGSVYPLDVDVTFIITRSNGYPQPCLHYRAKGVPTPKKRIQSHYDRARSHADILDRLGVLVDMAQALECNGGHGEIDTPTYAVPDGHQI